MYKKLKSIFRRVSATMLLSIAFLGNSFAQELSTATTEVNEGFWQSLMSTDPLLLTILVLIGLVMILLLVTLSIMVNTIGYMMQAMEKKNVPAEEYVPQPSLWDRIYEKLVTGKLYAEKEERTSMMLDHDYDGIKEMDYGLPPWLSAIFIVTIGFAIIYLIQIWGIGTIDDQLTEYNDEMAQAEISIAAWRDKQSNLIDENSVVLASDEASLNAGLEIFIKECKACHAADGGGGVGPNLTDNYWIHGGSISDLFATIKYGVPEKGMISWQTKLNPGEMQNVASYILTLVGTTPANPKEPQGELYVPENENQSPSSDSTEIVELANN